ncbi:MAG: universal stress protein [Gammaproteobacteria bacterium]
MTRTLLAATDFSAPARHALERAAQLAQAQPGTRLTLAHIISTGALDALRRLLPAEAGGMESTLFARAEQQLGELATTLAKRYECPVDTAVSPGDPLRGLLELADTRDADLLVLGARGAHFVRELLLGSTTERLLRKTQRPLLAVKQRAQAPYRRVLAPVDFSPHAAAAINAAYAWLPDAEFVLLNVFAVELESTFRLAGIDDDIIHAYRAQARDAATEEMESFVARLQVPAKQVSRVFVHGAATLRIVEHEQSLDADLIVMGKRGQSVMEELLLGSVTKYVLAHSASDVFIASHHS